MSKDRVTQILLEKTFVNVSNTSKELYIAPVTREDPLTMSPTMSSPSENFWKLINYKVFLCFIKDGFHFFIAKGYPIQFFIYKGSISRKASYICY